MDRMIAVFSKDRPTSTVHDMNVPWRKTLHLMFLLDVLARLDNQ